MKNKPIINKTFTAWNSLGNNHAFLRNGNIVNADFIELSVRQEMENSLRVWVEAGNQRTGLFNGWITMEYDTMVELAQKFLEFHYELQGLTFKSLLHQQAVGSKE